MGPEGVPVLSAPALLSVAGFMSHGEELPNQTNVCQICFLSGWGLFCRKGLEKLHTWVGCQGLGSDLSSVTSKLSAHFTEITDPTWIK